MLKIFNASPSTIAVLPTPGSPTNKGLFLVLLHKICAKRSTSTVLPIKRSNLFCSAFLFKLTQYVSKGEFVAALLLLGDDELSKDPPYAKLSTFVIPWEIKFTTS